jgi:transcriptional regulator with XRE-family HTH domain
MHPQAHSELYHLRVQAKLTQRQLADKSGVSKSAISLIETWAAIPRIDTVCRLAKALEMRPEELFLKLTEGAGYL